MKKWVIVCFDKEARVGAQFLFQALEDLDADEVRCCVAHFIKPELINNIKPAELTTNIENINLNIGPFNIRLKPEI